MRRPYTNYTTEQRSKLIDLVRAGTAVPEAAARLGVQAATAYTWTQAVRTSGTEGGARRGPHGAPLAPESGTRFARLVTEADRAATIVVRVGGAAIEVRPGFDAELLRTVVVALQGGAA